MKKITSIILILATVVFTAGSLFFPNKNAMAATISAAYDKMSNQNISAHSTNTIKFKSTSGVTATTNTIAITFPSDFDFTNSVYGDITMTEGASTGLENSETIGSSASTSQWGAAFTDGSCGTNKKCVLTLTAPTSGNYYVTAGDYVIITYTSTAHETNPTSAGSKSISIATTSSTSDTGTIAVPIISNSTVSLDATVAPSLSFSSDNSALHFGTLSASAPQYATSTTGSASDLPGNIFTITTNATSGYTLAYNAAATLTSGTNTIAEATITNSATGTAGNAQFAMSAVYSGGSNLTSTYNHATGSGNWKFNHLGETVITSTGAANAETVAMHYIANISNTTPAGIYVQTNTWVATANF